MCSSILSLTSASDVSRCQCHSPASLSPEQGPRMHLQAAGWASGSVWTDAENLASPLGFDPRTAQPVASRYTD